MLHYHHQYYGLIRHLDCYLLFRFLIRRFFSERLFPSGKRRFPKFLDYLSGRVVTNTPEMLYVPLYSQTYNTDFAHTPTSRPSLFLIFTRLPLCSFALQPGLLRRTLSDTLSSRLDIVRFQTLSGFSLRGFRVLPRLGLGRFAPSCFTQLDLSKLCLALNEEVSFSLSR